MLSIYRSAALSLLLLLSASAYADEPFVVTLTGAAEVPSVSTPAVGTAQITILPDRTVSGGVKVAGMAGTMAHIHEAEVGMNGPPIVTLNKVSADTFMVPAGTRLSKEQYVSLLASKLYVNVHSEAYPDGEIRGQLLHPKRTAP